MAVSGSQPFAVLLCKVHDDTAEPRPLSFMRDLIANRGTGGLNDYWVEVSGGDIDLDGTDVFDWRSVGQSRDDYVATHADRRSKIEGAMAAFPEVDFTRYTGIIAVFNHDLGDVSASGNGVLADLHNMSVTFLAHETGHVLGLAHSFDRSDRRLESWSQLGEYYDSYDVMSAMNVKHGNDRNFGATGPRLCTPNLDRMGWLQASRIWRPPFGGGSFSDIVTLVSLSRPGTPGYLAAAVGDLYVEFRTVESWDSGLPRAGVLIHRLNDPNAVILAPTLPPKPGLNPSPYRNPQPYYQDWQPGQTYGPDLLTLAINGGTTVAVLGFDEREGTARVAIHVTLPRFRFVEPSALLGDTIGDGGGWVVLPSGKVVKVPPRSPVVEALKALAVVAEVEEAVDGRLQRQLNQVLVDELERVAERLRP